MKKSWLVIGMAVAMAIVVIGCGSSGSKKTPTSTKAATKVATKATAATPAATSGVPATSEATTTAAPTVKTTTDATMGVLLTNSEGYTLYHFANDTANVSNCNGACAGVWPPLTISAGSPTGDAGVSGTLATIDRADGTKQVTYNGVPLYRYSGDTAPDQTNGEGVAGLWHVVTAQ